MAPNASSARSVFGWQPHWQESQRLAESLRYCRLTLLCGEAGSGKTSLLTEGLMPLLQRRAVDASWRSARGNSPVIMPFPERRSAARARLAEIVVLFDAGGGDAPLARLHASIDAALRAVDVLPDPLPASLAGRVRSLADRWGTKFLFVVDRFESLLKPPANVGGREELLDELVELLNLRLPANVLVALRSEDHVLLEPFERRLHAVDPEMMVLPGRHEDNAPPAKRAPVIAPQLPERSAAAQARWHEDSQLPVLADVAEPVPAAGIAMRPRLPAAGGAPTAGAPVAWRWRLVLVVAPLALMALALPLFWVDPPLAAGAPDRAALRYPADDAVPRAAPALLPGAAATPLPRLDVLVESEGASAPRLPAELTRAVAARSEVTLNMLPTPGGLAALPSGDGPARLAIVRYDALQAAANDGQKRALDIVAPLYTEEVYVVARADSPLQFIHDIKGRRVNVGAAQGGRALTAGNVYRRMFGAPVPPTPDAALDAPTALQRLAGGQTLDVVLLVAAQPAAAWAGLAPETRRALKLLRLAPDHPASRRALQGYLPATVREPGAPPTPTLAAMTFLVSAGKPDETTADTVAQLTRSLCDSLPALQRDGDAKWREVRPGLRLPTAWPTARAAEAALSDCARPGVASFSQPPATRLAGNPPTPSPGARP